MWKPLRSLAGDEVTSESDCVSPKQTDPLGSYLFTAVPHFLSLALWDLNYFFLLQCVAFASWDFIARSSLSCRSDVKEKVDESRWTSLIKKNPAVNRHWQIWFNCDMSKYSLLLLLGSPLWIIITTYNPAGVYRPTHYHCNTQWKYTDMMFTEFVKFGWRH